MVDKVQSAYPRDARWTGCLGSRARARSIQAHPLVQASVDTNGGSAHAWMEAAWSRRLSSRSWFGCRRLGDDCGHDRFHKHAVPHGTVKIPFTLNTAIVLPRLLIKLDSDPVSHLEVRLACKPNSGSTAIAELDRLASFKVRHYGQSRGRCRIVTRRVAFFGRCSELEFTNGLLVQTRSDM